jgi:exodeoxyribonuclease-5
LRGFSGPLPQSGEKLVCLRNNRKKGLLNGALFTVKSSGVLRSRKVRMLVEPEESSGKFQRVAVIPQFFEGGDADIPFALRKDSDEFDFGYALTVHKAQGSQWDSVVLFDESFAFREHRARWLYTGVTRAAKTLTLVM